MLKNRETVRHNAEHFARLNSLCWTRSPLFCLHAGEGTSFPYLPLARHLDQVRTVFGVSCRRILNHDHHDESLVTMAADYAQSIRHIQPKGPYYLLGWSLGGALASLVANQLETQCEHVAMLSLVDPLIPGTDEAQEENWKESLREFVETVLPNSYMNRFDELIMRAENSAEETVAGILRELVADEKAPDAIALPKLEMGIAGVGPDLLARGFCVARYLRELARSIDALPPTFVAPHCWWDSNRPESHRLALYAQLGQPAASTELVSAHSEMMNDDALSMALVQLLS
nr:alpha/beta fold hydrolase [Diaphorobacter sp. HDW4A]